MPAHRLPLDDRPRLVQAHYQVIDERIKRPGKQELSLRTHATVELLVACLDGAEKLLDDLGDPKGEHRLSVDREIKQSVNDLRGRATKLMERMMQRFGGPDTDAITRMSLLLVQAGFNLTQLHDQSIAEDWLTDGAERAAKMLTVRYGGVPRPDRVTTWREVLHGMMAQPEAALDQPAQLWGPNQSFYRVASIDILGEDHYNPAHQGWLPGSELTDEEKQAPDVARLSAGTVLMSLQPSDTPLQAGELLPDIAPEHRSQLEGEQLAAARDVLRLTYSLDPGYMPMMLPRAEQALAREGGHAQTVVRGSASKQPLDYLIKPQELAIPQAKMDEFIRVWEHSQRTNSPGPALSIGMDLATGTDMSVRARMHGDQVLSYDLVPTVGPVRAGDGRQIEHIPSATGTRYNLRVHLDFADPQPGEATPVATIEVTTKRGVHQQIEYKADAWFWVPGDEAVTIRVQAEGYKILRKVVLVGTDPGTTSEQTLTLERKKSANRRPAAAA